MKKSVLHEGAICARHNQMVRHSRAVVEKLVACVVFMYLSTQTSTVLTRSGAGLELGDYFIMGLFAVGALLAARSSFKSFSRLMQTSDIVLVPIQPTDALAVGTHYVATGRNSENLEKESV